MKKKTNKQTKIKHWLQLAVVSCFIFCTAIFVCSMFAGFFYWLHLYGHMFLTFCDYSIGNSSYELLTTKLPQHFSIKDKKLSKFGSKAWDLWGPSLQGSKLFPFGGWAHWEKIKKTKNDLDACWWKYTYSLNKSVPTLDLYK